MKIVHYALAISLLACFAGCKNRSAQENDLFVLDAEAAINNREVFSLDDISDKIEFTVLDDSREESLIGDIYMVQLSESGFYIVDTSVSSVKFFDSTGKFTSSKGRVGRGPDEFVSISYIAVDYAGDNLYIASGDGRVLAYNTENKLFARNDSVSDVQISFFDDELVVLRYPSTAPVSDSVSVLDIYSPELHFQSSVWTNDKSRVGIDVGFQVFSNNGRELLVKRELSDTLYQYRNRALEPIYRMDMGRYFFPPEMYDFGMFERWDEFYRPIDIFDGNRYIIAKLQNGLMGDISYLIFDKENPSEPFSPAGPDGDSGIFLDGVAVTPCCIYENRLVGYIQPIDLMDNRDALSRPDLQAIARRLTENDNPVIVTAELN